MWALLLLAAQPFWETVPPENWSDFELVDVLTKSPWAGVAVDVAPGSIPLRAYLATAKPMRDAEVERRRRAIAKGRLSPEDAAAPDEYREYLESKQGSVIVLALDYQDGRPFLEGDEIKRMEAESRMIVGKRKFNLIGHFPPTSRDPFVRLVFPREVTAEEIRKSKEIRFELYLPIAGSYREAAFAVRTLSYRGQPAF